ncbi:MAG: NAD-dependent epimerase/dehydratase family protein [Candidatus Babeliales bacterium]
MVGHKISIACILLFLFHCISYASFYEIPHQQQKTVIFNAYCSNGAPESFFKQAALYLPKVLEFLTKDYGKFILIIPSLEEPISPVGQEAPYIEGARVALAWASCYFRYEGLDVEVVRMAEANQDFVSAALSVIGQKRLRSTVKSLDDQFEERIQNFDNLAQIRIVAPQLQVLQLCEEEKPLIVFDNFKQSKKKVVITGGAGFIGSYVAEYFLEHDYEVLVLDNFFCCNDNNLKIHTNNSRLHVETFDISQPFDVMGSVDMVIHLASVPSPADYYKYPKETLKSGLMGTCNTLELARKKNARYICASTSEVYGDPTISPQREDYPGNVCAYGMRSQYDQSKRGAETLIKLYFEKYNFDVRIARIFNTYGPRMRLKDGRVITNFIGALLEGKPLTVYGDGNQTRSFCYVTNTVDMLIQLSMLDQELGNAIEDRIFNIGNPFEFSINELVMKVDVLAQKKYGKHIASRKIDNPDKTDPKIRKPDIQKFEKTFGKINFVPLQEGLEKTLHYFKG